MVSAGAANKKAFGIDRTTNPWSDMIGTEVIWVAAQRGRVSPITTNYIWQAREQGAKVIVQDPRITPIARTCDLFLPVKPGRDAALFAGVLNLMIERDWIDRDFIEAHTIGFDHIRPNTASQSRTEQNRRRHRRAGPIAPASQPSGAGGAGFCFTHAVSSITQTACRTRWARSTSCSPVAASVKPRAGTAPSSASANGQGGREHGRMRPAARMARYQQPRAPQVHRRRVEHRGKAKMPGPGVDAYEMFRRIEKGEIKGLIAICFNPKVSLPD